MKSAATVLAATGDRRYGPQTRVEEDQLGRSGHISGGRGGLAETPFLFVFANVNRDPASGLDAPFAVRVAGICSRCARSSGLNRGWTTGQPFHQFHLMHLRIQDYRSVGSRPVCFAMRESIFGPISVPS